MNYGSVCSGIEAATVAWHPLGWKPAFFAEIEKHPCSVLKHHYPDVPNLGDMTKFKEWPDYAIDLLIGGTPCQSFSVAGLRKGMADPRGNLALTFLAIADRYRPEWVVWENVPGVLSSEGGRDFGSFLGGLGQLGYGFAYRVLDAQFIRVESHPFAVPQRRRRVIVVAHLGDWRRAAAVLFERESLSGNSPPRREAGKDIAPTIRSGTPNGGKGHGARSGDSKDELIVPARPAQVAPTLGTGWGDRHPGSQMQDMVSQKGGHFVPDVSPAMKARDSKGPSSDGDGDGLPLITFPINTQIALRHEATGEATGMGIGSPDDPSFTLQAGHSHAVAFDTTQITSKTNRSNPQPGDPCHTLAKGADAPALATTMAVRRLTPVECCRLQGFPDDYLDCLKSDGPKYKALGNSMATNVIRWLGDRIEMVRKI